MKNNILDAYIKCTGCRLCEHICPKKCISFVNDREGFLVPQINKDICVNCGFQNVCQTCYAANYIQRGCSARRNMNICKMQKITFLATSKLLYKKYILKGQHIPNTQHGVEIYKDIEAISNITEILQEIEAEYET